MLVPISEREAYTMANPYFQVIDDALRHFSFTKLDELHHAIYSSLDLLSTSPRNMTHALVVYFKFNPTVVDKSLQLKVKSAEVFAIEDLKLSQENLNLVKESRATNSTQQINGNNMMPVVIRLCAKYEGGAEPVDRALLLATAVPDGRTGRLEESGLAQVEANCGDNT
ncbi:hypothetical protein RQP46_007650 [Phenoliferia psychrophenolica]